MTEVATMRLAHVNGAPRASCVRSNNQYLVNTRQQTPSATNGFLNKQYIPRLLTEGWLCSLGQYALLRPYVWLDLLDMGPCLSCFPKYGFRSSTTWSRLLSYILPATKSSCLSFNYNIILHDYVTCPEYSIKLWLHERSSHGQQYMWCICTSC